MHRGPMELSRMNKGFSSGRMSLDYGQLTKVGLQSMLLYQNIALLMDQQIQVRESFHAYILLWYHFSC